MDADKKNKVRKFLADERMATAVKEVMREAFLKPQTNKEVVYLAASRIAIDLLDDAWRELNKYKTDDEKQNNGTGNVGL